MLHFLASIRDKKRTRAKQLAARGLASCRQLSLPYVFLFWNARSTVQLTVEAPVVLQQQAAREALPVPRLMEAPGGDMDLARPASIHLVPVRLRDHAVSSSDPPHAQPGRPESTSTAQASVWREWPAEMRHSLFPVQPAPAPPCQSAPESWLRRADRCPSTAPKPVRLSEGWLADRSAFRGVPKKYCQKPCVARLSASAAPPLWDCSTSGHGRPGIQRLSPSAVDDLRIPAPRPFRHPVPAPAPSFPPAAFRRSTIPTAPFLILSSLLLWPGPALHCRVLKRSSHGILFPLAYFPLALCLPTSRLPTLVPGHDLTQRLHGGRNLA